MCGIKQSGGAECRYSFYDLNYLPGEVGEQNIGLTPRDFMPNAVAMQTVYQRAVFITDSGETIYYPGAVNLGISGAVTAGGDRSAISVVTDSGDVFNVADGSATQINGSIKVEGAQCPY